MYIIIIYQLTINIHNKSKLTVNICVGIYLCTNFVMVSSLVMYFTGVVTLFVAYVLYNDDVTTTYFKFVPRVFNFHIIII